MSDKIMLIDGNSILNRAFYGVPLLSDSKGRFTNGVFGFLNMLFRLIDEDNPKYIGVAFDLKAPTFRHKAYSEYKQGRNATPDELRGQFPLLKQMLKAMNIGVFEMEGFEADDILGTLSLKGEEKGLLSVIVSGDRDLLQLASKTVKIRFPKTSGGKTIIKNYYEQDLIDELGITPTEFIDFKALMGDKSDNIPGVPSVGEVTALKLIKEYKTVENTIENYDKITMKRVSANIREYAEQALTGKYLVTIVRDVPVDLDLDVMLADNMFNEESYIMVRDFGFKSLFAKFSVANKDKVNEVFIKTEEESPFDEVTEESNEDKESKKSEGNIDNAESIEIIENAETEKVSVINETISYKYIVTKNEAKDFFENLQKIETSYILVVDDGKFNGIVVYQEGIDCTYVEVSPLNDLSEETLLSLTKEFFENPEYKKIGLDIKTDIKTYREILNSDLEYSNYENSFDVMIGAYILNPLASSYDYEEIAKDYLDNSMLPSLEELLGKGKKKLSIESLEVNKRCEFVCNQCKVIYDAKEIIENKMTEKGQISLYNDIEFPLLFVLADMEKEGMAVNKETLLDYQKLIKGKENNLSTEIIEMAGEEFNINSPKQLGVILFEKLGLKGGKKTKTGYSTAVEVLEHIKNDHPIVEKILEYRHIAKLRGTYADGLLSVINEKTGKIHSTFNQAVTATGRISSTEPNLQNVPTRMEIGREVRKAFIPKDENYCFVDADYSQIELRVLACVADDEILINAFNENQDIHTLTASQVFNIPIDEVKNEHRRNAKAVNFGIIYGMGAFSLSQDLGITRAEAEAYIEAYFKRYPKIKDYLDTTIKNAKKNGYVETLFKRRRDMKELKSSNFALRSFGERVAMNMPIQGTAADIIKIAMVNVHKALKDGGFKSKLILQVHDELLIETHKDEEEQVSILLRENMEKAVNLAVLFKVDLHRGNSWYETK